ncbi:MAG: FAD-dependent oxidoreductase, partial [Caulobacterales bacterium]|nr:FAD-dependent oxidoreductase [Caulobacterales bacterium]
LSARPFRIAADSGQAWTADAVIIATGAQAKWLGLPSEEAFANKGMSACATCDGFFFRGKKVAVVGGGNSAVEEALYLANLAESVTLVHRRDSLRAEKVLQQRLLNHPKITVIWNHVVDEILGEEGEFGGVTGLRLRGAQGEAVQEIAVDGVFIAIGHQPASELFADQLQTKSGGYLVTAPDSTTTSIPGVFAASDVTDDIYRQAVTVAGMGCMAALEAEKYLAAHEAELQAAE